MWVEVRLVRLSLLGTYYVFELLSLFLCLIVSRVAPEYVERVNKGGRDPRQDLVPLVLFVFPYSLVEVMMEK